MKVLKSGLLTEVDCMIYLMPKTMRGSMQLSAVERLKPGFVKIASIDMKTKQFCIDGAWFHMEDFEFSAPEVEAES